MSTFPHNILRHVTLRNEPEYGFFDRLRILFGWKATAHLEFRLDDNTVSVISEHIQLTRPKLPGFLERWLARRPVYGAVETSNGQRVIMEKQVLEGLARARVAVINQREGLAELDHAIDHAEAAWLLGDQELLIGVLAEMGDGSDLARREHLTASSVSALHWLLPSERAQRWAKEE